MMCTIRVRNVCTIVHCYPISNVLLFALVMYRLFAYILFFGLNKVYDVSECCMRNLVLLITKLNMFWAYTKIV